VSISLTPCQTFHNQSAQAYGKAFYWGTEKFALKIRLCPKNKQSALKTSVYFNRMGPATLCKSVLYS